MGKTVTTYLIDCDPKGTQYSFISNKICQMFVIPRSNLAYLNEQEKLHKPAFYILIGEDEATKPQAYIGETENFKERVKDHDSKKAFWQKALVFVSKDEDMTKADVQYLEYRAITEAKQSNSFVLNENKQLPKAPNLPEHQRDAMDEFFEDIFVRWIQFVEFVADDCGGILLGFGIHSWFVERITGHIERYAGEKSVGS